MISECTTVLKYNCAPGMHFFFVMLRKRPKILPDIYIGWKFKAGFYPRDSQLYHPKPETKVNRVTALRNNWWYSPYGHFYEGDILREREGYGFLWLLAGERRQEKEEQVRLTLSFLLILSVMLGWWILFPSLELTCSISVNFCAHHGRSSSSPSSHPLAGNVTLFSQIGAFRLQSWFYYPNRKVQ